MKSLTSLFIKLMTCFKQNILKFHFSNYDGRSSGEHSTFIIKTSLTIDSANKLCASCQNIDLGQQFIELFFQQFNLYQADMKAAQVQQHFAKAVNGTHNEAAQPPRPQHLIDRQYTPLEIIGQGTFGKVYKVLGLEDQRLYALKMVLQQKKYKNRELSLSSQLDHPNIVRVQDHYFTIRNGQRYLNLVMNYMHYNLYQVLRNSKKKKTLPSKLTVKIWAFQLLKALAYLQDSKLAHRDLKPMNILINEDTNELQVCDFGSAKKICPGEVNVCYICSRYYRAPELMFGFNDYSTEIDMWSFGCILVEMLTTDTLFCGESTLDQIIEVIKVIGTPSQDYLEKSVEFRNLKIPHMKPHSWKAVLKRYDPEPQLLDLIAKVLVFDKSQRIKPCQALAHPYFSDLTSPDNIGAVSKVPHIFDFSQNKFVGYAEESKRILEFFQSGKAADLEEQTDKAVKSIGEVSTSRGST